MPLLSATSAIEPAFEQMSRMLFRPFRFKTWLKLGFIGWLAGGATSGNFNFRFPQDRGGVAGDLGKDIAHFVRVWVHDHLPTVLLLVVIAMIVGLVFIYLSCRFRFILFDSILARDPRIARGWTRYGGQAQRFLGFQLAFLIISFALLLAIIGLPLWHAYQRGVFSSGDIFAIFRVLVPVLLAVFLLAIISAIVASLANDFVVPLLALDDMTIGDAWHTLRSMMAAEPWAYTGYLLMKFVLSIAASVMVAFAGVLIVLVLLIPGVIVGIIGVTAAKAMGTAAAIVLAVLGVALVLAVAVLLGMILTAPVAAFFTSYSLHFFGGRYPKLGAMLWPEPPVPVGPPSFIPPPPSVPPPPFTSPA